MRFTILSQYYAPEVGAPQVRLESLAQELVAAGHEVQVVTAMPNYPRGAIAPGYRRKLWTTETIRGIPVRRVWLYASSGRGARRLLSYLSFTATCMLGLVRTGPVDVLFVESPPLFLSIPGALFARLRRAPMVFNVADLWPDAAVDVGALKPGRMLDLARRLERWSYRRAVAVNAVTEGIRAELIAKGVPPDDILFLPNGVDTDRFSPQRGDSAVRVELGLPTGPLLAFTGTVGFAQGLDAVVDAMATVQDLPVQLAIVGDGSARAELVQRAASAGLSSIHFVDPVPPESIARLLPGCLAGVVSLADLATNQGARPSKLFPVMASGIPVLYCGTGEGAQLVERAAAGIAVGNASAPIADAIRRLSTRDDERGAYGRGGRAFVLAEMSWTRLVGDWLQELDVRLTTRSTRTKKRRSPHA